MEKIDSFLQKYWFLSYDARTLRFHQKKMYINNCMDFYEKYFVLYNKDHAEKGFDEEKLLNLNCKFGEIKLQIAQSITNILKMTKDCLMYQLSTRISEQLLSNVQKVLIAINMEYFYIIKFYNAQFRPQIRMMVTLARLSSIFKEMHQFFYNQTIKQSFFQQSLELCFNAIGEVAKSTIDSLENFANIYKHEIMELLIIYYISKNFFE